MTGITLPDRDAVPNLASYAAERSRYRSEVPDTYNPTIDIVERWAAEAPDDLALVSLDGTGETVAEHTVAELTLLSRQAARALLDLGVGKGDPVFIMLPRVPAWYAAMLGVIRIGAIAMPGTNQLTAKDIAYRIRSADRPGRSNPPVLHQRHRQLPEDGHPRRLLRCRAHLDRPVLA